MKFCFPTLCTFSWITSQKDNIPMLEWKVNTSLEAMTCWIESAVSSVSLPKPKVEWDKVLYSPEADFQGACQKETAAKAGRTVASTVGSCRINQGVARVSISCRQTLPYWSSYMENQSGLTPSTPRRTENRDGLSPMEGYLKVHQCYHTASTKVVCELAGMPSVETVANKCKRGYTALYVELVRRVEKHYGSSVTKDKSHSVNGKYSSLEARMESGLVYQYTTSRHGWREAIGRWIQLGAPHIYHFLNKYYDTREWKSSLRLSAAKVLIISKNASNKSCLN